MSARLFNCFTDAQDNAVFSAIGLRELRAIMDMDPSSMDHYWFDTYLTKRSQEREEHVTRLRYKYNYLICQMEWILSGPRYSYVRKEVGLPEDHLILFEEAIQWYQRSQQYYIEHDIMVSCPNKLFLKKWLELYPWHATQLTTLKAELLLSNQAFGILQSKSPKGEHLEQMDILYLTKVELLEELIPSLSDVESLESTILDNCVDDLTF
jgi:hypothetical protein